MCIILKNENKNSEMVEIMTQIHDYVPRKPCSQQYTVEDTGEVIAIPTDKFHRILIGGDQLTIARARSVKKAKINSVDPSLRLDGLLPVAEDWHTRLNLLQVKTHKHFHYNNYVCRLYGSILYQLSLQEITVHCINYVILSVVQMWAAVQRRISMLVMISSHP